MKASRILHKLFANIFGYFWTPCPLCGIQFGGHEVKQIVFVYLPDGTKKQICPSTACLHKAGVLNADTNDAAKFSRPQCNGCRKFADEHPELEFYGCWQNGYWSCTCNECENKFKKFEEDTMEGPSIKWFDH